MTRVGLGLAVVAWMLLGPSSVAEAPRGAEPIFTDDFESATTAAWTETIDPVYVRFVEPMPGSALDDPSPPLVLQLWSPPGVPIDLSSLVVLHHVAPGQVDELALGCSFEPPVAVCSSDANFADGAVELEASVADGLGQVAAPTRVRFTVDTAPPTLAVAAPPDGLVTRAPGVTLEGMVSDGAAAPASVRLALDGVEVPVTPDGTWSALRTLEEGLNAFALVATDAAGNTTLAGHSVVRDTTAPGPVDVGRLTIEADAGALVITGAAGAAEAGARVRILHQDTGAVVLVTAAADGSFTASLAGAAGDVLVFEQLDAADNLSPPAPLAGPWSLPPDPATLAPPHDPTVVWDPVASLDFLYHGPQALQTLPDGSPLEPSTIEPWRISWLRGRVTDRSGAPLGGAVVRVLGYPELGVTRTRLDGAFDLVVNGGGLAVPLVVDVTRAGFLGVQRPVHAPWRGVVWVNDLVLVPLDPLATPIEMGSPVAQLAESTPQTDASGTRRATLLFPRGTTATRTLPDGTVEPLAALTVRASEYTVGPRGPLAMPGPLPPAVAYTYAVELSVDEARAVGATRVDFDRPVSLYVDNFLDFPVGAVAPVGWYDRAAGVWQAAPNGVVLRLVGVIAEGNPAEGLAAIDLDGDGIGEPSSVLEAEYGLDAIERRAMAERFRVGKSLWRVRVDHFTPWDVNWPYVPPDDAEPPPEPPPPEPPPPPPDPDTPPEDPAGVGDDGDDGDEPGEPVDSSRDDNEDPCVDGSIVECESQVLRTMRPLVGTTLHLAYTSARTPGRVTNQLVRVAVTGTEPPPASARAVRLQIHARGRLLADEEFEPAAGIVYQGVVGFDDPFGRVLTGTQEVTVRRGLVYPVTYTAATRDRARSWGRFGDGAGVVGSSDRASVTLWREDVYPLAELSRPVVGGLDARAQQLGGWSLDVHHVYEPSSRTLYLGTGQERRAAGGGFFVSLLAGARSGGSLADGVPAAAVDLADVRDIAFDAEGRLVFTADHRVRRIDDDGLVETLAGTDEPCTVGGGGDGGLSGPLETSSIAGDDPDPCGLGGPATAARLHTPSGLTVSTDGSITFADEELGCVLRLVPGGGLVRLAGLCTPEVIDDCPPPCELGDPEGDGAPGDEIPTPLDVAYDAGGTLYIATTTGDGLVVVVPGGGFAEHTRAPRARALAVDANGRVVAASASDLFRLELDGSVTPLAGNGDADEASPDGTVALGAPVGGVLGLLPLPDGSLLFGERESRSVRRITPYGTLATVAGSGDVGALELGVASRQTPFERPIALALTPARTVAVAEAFSGRVVELRAALPPWQTEGYEIPSTDGAVVHRFDSGGHHLETVHGITRAPLHTFAYDADGLLTSVTDGDGLVTTIERGTETAIVSPYGERTVLDVSDDGWLEGLTNPAGEVRAFAYTEGGLLTAATDARGHTKSYEWSPFGRLTRTGDAGDGFQSFTRSNRTLAGEPNFVVRRETATGGATAYRHHTWSTGEEMRRTTHADGTRSWTVTVPSTGTRERAHSSGMRTVQRETPSPLHGLAVGVPSRTSIVRPSGMRSSMSLSIDAELGTPGDASSLEALTTTWTIDGRSGSSRFDAASRTKTETSPLGRLRSTQYDALGRMTRHERPRTETIEAHYTPSGRLAQLRTGDGAPGSDDAPRVQTLHYDAFDRLERVEDPIGRVTSYSYDAARRLESVVLPGADPGGDPGATIGLGWDASSNLASFTPPGRPAYTFGYTPRDQLERVTLPDVGDGASSATFRYDAGRRLTGFARSDGRGLALDYNARQQLIRATETRVDDATGEPEPVRARGFTYDAESGHLSRVEDTTSGESLAFTYDGSVPASVEWSGTVAGRIEATVDASFRIAALEVTVGTETDVITYAYDDDSLLTRAGALAIAREADTGRIASASVGTIETAVSYTPFGELAAQTVTVDGAPLVAETYGYDARGWLVERAATRAGVTTTTTYSYDPRGRLEAVEVDGAPVAVYGYDANSNRIAAADAFGTVTPADVELDARDRLLAVGGVTYTYTDAGDLVARAAGAAVDTFTYDVAGNLRHVELADGRVIDYAIDPSHRRIGKSIDGVLVEGYLYQDRLNPIVQLDGSGAPVARFVYGTRPHVPDLMLRGGVIYRYVHDVRGSPRFVLDTRDGSIVQELQFDAFGRVVLDTNPGFQPFGFAGGLYDRDTGLVRLGARDYDPTLGRWTTPDPAGFGGGPNLYAYAGGNPVNFIDPNGAEPVTVAAAAWAVAEVGLTAWDVWEMGRTFSDPCATTTEKAIVAGGFAVGVVLPLGGYGAAGKKLLKQGVTNEVPDRLARAIPGDVNFPTLGRLDAEDVFVTSADDIAGMNADEIAERLTVPHSPEFTVFEFPTPEAGLATPINRPDPGFIGGGRTAGGAREYVLPNGPIPSGATRRVVR